MTNKYKVVDKHTVRPEYDDLPKHFLGNTIEEAEDTRTEAQSSVQEVTVRKSETATEYSQEEEKSETESQSL